jgi:hypothetical protein
MLDGGNGERAGLVRGGQRPAALAGTSAGMLYIIYSIQHRSCPEVQSHVAALVRRLGLSERYLTDLPIPAPLLQQLAAKWYTENTKLCFGVWLKLLTMCVCARAERGVAFNLRAWHLCFGVYSKAISLDLLEGATDIQFFTKWFVLCARRTVCMPGLRG